MKMFHIGGSPLIKEVSLEAIVRDETANRRVKDYMPYRDEAAIQRHIKYLQELDTLHNLIFQFYSDFQRAGVCCKLARNFDDAIGEIVDICRASPSTIFVVHGLIVPGYSCEKGIELEKYTQDRINNHHELIRFQRHSIINSMLDVL